jgi:hypothetical protein
MNTDRAAAARLETWLDLADRGWHLFPVRPGSKVPAITQWEQRATTEPDRLTWFFTTHPDHNAGIACGPSGLLVVDCDLPKPGQRLSRVDGREQLKALAYENGGVPATWEVFTPSGGTHLYFRAPADRTLGNSSRLLGPLLDTRGRGGQVVAPGSVLPSGAYSLLDNRDPAALPDWIAKRLSAPPEPADRAERTGPVGDRSAYVAAAVQAEVARIRDAARGEHNTAVFTASRALGQFAAGGLLDPADARRAVLTAADRMVTGPCACTAAEIAATVRSGLAYGARRPRELPTQRTTDREPPSAEADPVTSDREADGARGTGDRVEAARAAVTDIDATVDEGMPTGEPAHVVDEASDGTGLAR